jgi:SAM-dependent methyltransferase
MEPNFAPDSFDLAYSAGLFHELDVRDEPAASVLEALVSVTRPGGRVATSDFVDTVPSVQIEEERLQAALLKELFGRRLYGVGSPERLVALHGEFLSEVFWSVDEPLQIRHLHKLVLEESEPVAFELLPSDDVRSFRERYEGLRELIRREGYTRPSSLYLEGVVTPG